MVRRVRVMAVAVALSAAACRSSGPMDSGAMRAPDPNDCNVQVWDAPNHRGTTEFISGPVQLPRLGDLPGGRSWRDRIRSLRTGHRALVTVWTDEEYMGRRWQLAQLDYEALPTPFDAQVKSLQILCARATAE